MSKFSLRPPLKKAQKAVFNAFWVPMTDTKQQTQPTQQRYELRSWVWLAPIVIVVVLVGGRLLFFEGNNFLQWPLKAREWTGFGESRDKNVSVVVENSTEKQPTTSKSADKTTATQDKTTKTIDKTTTNTERLQPAKTLWDWASLLLAPATLAGLGFWFQSSQEKAKRAQEKAGKVRDADQQRERALQDYFDYLSALLVDKQLKQCLPPPTTPSTAPTTESPQVGETTAVGAPKAETRIDAEAALDVVKAKTLSLFRLFDLANPTDMVRKASVLAFLGNTGLLKFLDLDLRGSHWANANLRRAQLSGVDFNGADFSSADFSSANLKGTILKGAYLGLANLFGANLFGADLSGTNLTGANLFGVNLNKADLSGACLTGANLTGTELRFSNLIGALLDGADLTGVNLFGADLTGADLTKANLKGANLRGAILLGVDLSKTEALTPEQLGVEGVNSPFLCHVTLPEGFTVDPQRDCAKLPAVLLERYPNAFKDLEAAETFMKSTGMEPAPLAWRLRIRMGL